MATDAASKALQKAQGEMAEAKDKLPGKPETFFGHESQPPMSLAQQQLCRSALCLAKEALLAFRQNNQSEKKVAALKVVAEAHMAIGESFEAMMAVSDELEMVKRTADKLAEAAVAELLAEVQLSRDESGSAAQSLLQACSIYDELNNSAAKAKCLQSLAELKLKLGRGKDALKFSMEALALYQSLKDEAGQELSNRLINRGYAESGQLEKAPKREDAVRALKDLAQAVETKDRDAWTTAIAKLNKSSAYTDADVQDLLRPVLQADRQGATSFLQSMGVCESGSNVPKLIINEFTSMSQYPVFRVHGLAYGPRFRCSKHLSTVNVEGNPDHVAALSCISLSDEAAEWEKSLEFNPGMLDNCLQQGVAFESIM